MQSYTLPPYNRDENIDIHGFVRCCTRLGIDAKQIFDELCDIHVYGPRSFYMRTVLSWAKDFKGGKLSVKDCTRLRRPKTSITEGNGKHRYCKGFCGTGSPRFSMKIYSRAGISEGNVQTNPKKYLHRRQIYFCSSCVTEEQKKKCLKCARELMKIK